MTLMERVKKICLTPTTEWPVIAGETTSTADLMTTYVAPLAAIGAAAGFIGGSIVGQSLPFVGRFRIGVTTGLTFAVYTVVMAIVGVAILAFVINALAPTFGGRKDSAQALKVAAYSYTPAWVAGVLLVLPALGVLALIGALYGIYLLYLGLPRLMQCQQEKAAGYTVAVVVSAIVLSIVVSAIGTTITGAALFGSGALGGASLSSGNVTFDKNTPAGALQQLSGQLEANGKKIEAAEKAGDANAAAAAAADTLGQLLGGGNHVDAVAADELKQFVPDSFAGLKKTRSSAEKNGFAGFMVSKADASYGESDKTVDLSISDSGGASGLLSLADWASTGESESEDQDGFERTHTVGGRLVHEKMSKSGGGNEYSILVGKRFVVTAESTTVDLDALRQAVSSLDLAKLDSMKNEGVRKP